MNKKNGIGLFLVSMPLESHEKSLLLPSNNCSNHEISGHFNLNIKIKILLCKSKSAILFLATKLSSKC